MAYSSAAVKTFLERQTQLFDEPVAEGYEDAEAFLEEVMASELKDLRAVRKWLDEGGMDVGGMSDDELISQAEVFPLPDGRYLIVEG